MQLLSKIQTQVLSVTGQKSDGSDQVKSLVPVWLVMVLDDMGLVQSPPPFNHDPTSAEIYAAVTASTFLAPVTKSDWARAMARDYATWQMWKNLHAEAITRGLAAAVLTALTTQENAAWSQLASDILAWNSAS